MTSNNFKLQIEEDIEEYQHKYPYIPEMKKTEWAFNFWILDKLYSEDEDIIVDRIVDYNDKGIDCFVWHEEQLDLYLIQNKFFGEKTTLSLDYVQNDFLTRALTALQNGTYSRSEELQNIYTKYSGKKGFSVNLIIYVTNNVCKTPSIMKAVESFNKTHRCEIAVIYGLNEIKELYYREPNIGKRTMTFQLQTINKGTILSVNKNAYNLPQAIDARYIMTPVYSLYQMYRQARKEEYPIFDSNIREYLGSTGTVNKKIRDTLKNSDERKNFFFYNNGVTVIVKSLRDCGTSGKVRKIEIQDPQIVNGCQTVSTISELFSSLPEDTLETDFQDTFVIVKLLIIPDDSDEMTKLRKNIVTYNNSQNSIDQKTFAASSDEFKRLQIEFLKKGLLICIKQSDKYQYTKVTYKNAAALMKLNKELMKKYGMTHLTHTKDFLVILDKFLQVILAFVSTAQDAVQKKSRILIPGNEQNKKVLDFIRNDNVTIDALCSLWMLYIRSEHERGEGKIPIPLYVIHCLSRYECKGDPKEITTVLADGEKINRLIGLYKMTITGYFTSWQKKYSGGYNDMIKSQIDDTIMDQSRHMALAMLS